LALFGVLDEIRSIFRLKLKASDYHFRSRSSPV
jgi:hypothetical protein